MHEPVRGPRARIGSVNDIAFDESDMFTKSEYIHQGMMGVYDWMEMAWEFVNLYLSGEALSFLGWIRADDVIKKIYNSLQTTIFYGENN